MLLRNVPALGTALTVVLLITGAAAAEPVVVSSSDQGIVLRYEPGSFSTRTVNVGDREYAVLSVEGADLLGRPGAPDIPVVRMVLAVPPCRAVELSVATGGGATESGPRVLPGLTPVETGRDEVSSSLIVEGEEYSTRGLWPPQAATVSKPTWLSRQRVVHVELFPCQVEPSSGSVVRHGSIEVALSFVGLEEPVPPRGTSERWENLYRSVLGNYESGLAWRSRPAAKRGRPDEYYDTSANWLRLTITRTGLHGIGHEDLVAAGVDPAGVDPASVRVFTGPGVSVPEGVDESRPDWMSECTIEVQGGADGSFDEGDRIAFYATAEDAWADELELDSPEERFYENRYTNESCCWMTWESSGTPFEDPPSRMSADDLQDDPSPTAVTDYRARAHFEDNRDETQGRGDNFYMYQMKDPTPEHRRYYVRLTRVVTDSTGYVRTRMDGNSTRYNYSPDHIVQVSLNGAEAFVAEWDGYQKHVGDAGGLPMVDYLPDEPGDDYNVIDFYATRPDTFHKNDNILIDWYELEYWRDLWGDLDTGDGSSDDQLVFGSSGRTGVLEYTLDGFESGEVSVYKLIDRKTLRTVPGVTTGSTANGYGATFQDDVADTASYIAVSPGGYIVPGIEADTPTDLRTDVNVDYVMIAYDGFYDEALRLMNYRESAAGGGYDVKLVRVSDVYDEFSWGLVDVGAIRDYLKFLSDEADVPPTHMLLIGDASADYRHYLTAGVQCYLPTVYTGGAYWPTDVWYVGFESGQYEPGMACGRLSVRSSAELSTIIDKIQRYERDEVQGVWKNTAVLIGDDEWKDNYGSTTNLEYVHTQQAEQISTDILPWCIDRRKIYLMEYEFEPTFKEKPRARADVLEVWKEGALLLNYTGHGNELLMAHELIFVVDDIPKLTNIDRLPLFFAASCRLNKFDMDDSDSIGEILVKSPVGGSVASIGSTRDSGSGYNSALNRAFLKHTFGSQRVSPRAVMDFGQAFQAAFIETGADTHVWPNNTKFVIIGDPATTFVSPEGSGLIDDDGLEPLRRRDTVTVTGSNAGATEDADGVVLVRVRDSADTSGYIQPFVGTRVHYHIPGEVVFEGASVVGDGDFTADFVVSALAEEGDFGRIRAYFYDGFTDGSMSLEEVTIADSVVVSDAIGPDIALSFEDGVTTVLPGDELEVRLSDENGVNLVNRAAGDGIVLLVNGGQDSTDITSQFVYDLGSAREGAVVYELPSLGLGNHSVSVSANDNMGNRSTKNLAFEIASAADFKIRHVANHPNPFRGDASEGTTIMFELPVSATVTIDIFTVGGRRIRRLDEFTAPAGSNEVGWNGLDQEGDQLANGVYLYRIHAVSGEYRGDKADVIGRAVIMR